MASGGGLRKTRRRLSVVSDNKLIEGVATIALDASDPTDVTETSARTAVSIYAGVCKKGYAPYNPRKKNQDSIIMTVEPGTGALMLAALDGHGEQGELVSGYFRQHLPTAVFSHAAWPADPLTALKECLEEIEEEVIKDATIDTDFSGSTAIITITMGTQIYVACIGDSRITGGVTDASGNIVAEEISHDHKPDDPEEKARINAKGGRVFAVKYDDGFDGPARVWLKDMDIPGLAMSRALGDCVAKMAGVISTPTLTVHQLRPDSKFIVLASDGLWEFVTNQEAVDMIKEHSEPKAAVDALLEESTRRWMREENVVDDTTIIVAFIDTSRCDAAADGGDAAVAP